MLPKTQLGSALGVIGMLVFVGAAAGCRDSQAAPLHGDLVTTADPPGKTLETASPAGKLEMPSPDKKEPAATADKAPPVDGTLTLSAVGDCTLGSDYRVTGAEGTFDEAVNQAGGDLSAPFAGVVSVLSKDDLTIANLEGPLSHAKPSVDHTFVFNGKPEYAEALAKGSVEMVNLANNHAGDFGTDGMKQTILAVDKAGVGSFGNGRIDVRTVKGIEVVNIGYLGGGDGVEKRVVKDVKKHKRPDNLVIVTFHWGVEGSNVPIDDQTRLGHAVVDAGADLVLGHHPHVIQGIETYKGRHIVYSLGNFVFGGNSNPADKDSMIYQEVFAKEGGAVVSKENRVIPVSISSVSTRNDFHPVLLEGAAKERVLGRVREYSDKLVPQKKR
ncbi:MAG: CapA family protein [Polyangiaceae bacterium]